jgi:hypothetical protein
LNPGANVLGLGVDTVNMRNAADGRFELRIESDNSPKCGLGKVLGTPRMTHVLGSAPLLKAHYQRARTVQR